MFFIWNAHVILSTNAKLSTVPKHQKLVTYCWIFKRLPKTTTIGWRCKKNSQVLVLCNRLLKFCQTHNATSIFINVPEHPGTVSNIPWSDLVLLQRAQPAFVLNLKIAPKGWGRGQEEMWRCFKYSAGLSACLFWFIYIYIWFVQAQHPNGATHWLNDKSCIVSVW